MTMQAEKSVNAKNQDEESLRFQSSPDISLERVEELNEIHRFASPQDVLRVAIHELYNGKIALVSSFGAESAILLHMASEIDPNIPVIFVDTGKLFPETIAYRDQLAQRFGLTNIQTVSPDDSLIHLKDPNGNLWETDTDGCCHIRKVLPFDKALAPFVAEISGRKRFQNDIRSQLGFFEKTERSIKVNPLINWTPTELADYIIQHDLPRHPLVAKGYPSIGCAPCTSPVAEGEDPRAGRWRGADKTECGIHFVDGKPVRIAR